MLADQRVTIRLVKRLFLYGENTILPISVTGLSGTCQKLPGGKGGGNFKVWFGNEVTHPCNRSEIC